MAPGARVGGPVYTVVVVDDVVDEVLLDVVLLDVVTMVEGVATAGSDPSEREQATRAPASANTTIPIDRDGLPNISTFWPLACRRCRSHPDGGTSHVTWDLGPWDGRRLTGRMETCPG